MDPRRHLLIIRSVSLQQFEDIWTRFNIETGWFKRRFTVSILTHSHTIGHCMNLKPDAYYIESYLYSGDFSPYSVNKEDRKTFFKYPTIYIPTTNKSGSGFLNVILFAKALNPAARIVLITSEFKYKKLSSFKIVRMRIGNLFSNIASFILAKVMMLPIVVGAFLTIKIKQIISKGRFDAEDMGI